MLIEKRPRLVDRRYLDWLRLQPCIVTGDVGPEPICEPAHVRWLTGGGTGLKPSDIYCAPLRWDLHHKYPTGSGSDWLTLANEYPMFLRDLLLRDCERRHAEWLKS